MMDEEKGGPFSVHGLPSKMQLCYKDVEGYIGVPVPGAISGMSTFRDQRSLTSFDAHNHSTYPPFKLGIGHKFTSRYFVCILESLILFMSM